MAIAIPNLPHAVAAVTEDGCMPFEVAKFAAYAAALEWSFDADYGDADLWQDEEGPIGVDAGEFVVWLTERMEK